MFHSLGLENHQWRSKYISEPISLMDTKLKQIHKEGYKSLFMAEAHESRHKSKDKLIHLNYDDGYLDNWVYLFPLLRKYNLKATIFMTSDFIDPRAIVRDQNIHLDHQQNGAEENYAGFLSFSEMRLMEASGLVEIQSHAKSHTWYFKGPMVVDFWKPGSATKEGGPVWMLWNKFPALKPYYLTKAREIEDKIPYGTPIYEHGKSLETKRFFPENGALERLLIDEVLKEKDFFKLPDANERLMKIVNNYASVSGNYEVDEDYQGRVKEELATSKAILESGLGHEISGICWPGGGINQEVVDIAKTLGYKFFTLPSKWKKSPSKHYNDMIPRIGPLSKLLIKGHNLGYPSAKDFSNYLKYNNGYKVAKYIFFVSRVMKFIIKKVKG